MASVDFDTKALLAFRGRVSADAIRSQLGMPCTVTKDASGVAIVRFEFPSGGFSEYKFDTNAGHTLVESESDAVYRGGHRRRTSTKIEYSEAQGAWYPASIHSEEAFWQPESSVLARKTVTTVEITAFDVSAAIADSDFTLDGVGVHKGTRVYDGAADIDYRYGVRQELGMGFTDLFDEIEPDLTSEAVEWESDAAVAPPAVAAQEDASTPPSQDHKPQTADDAPHTGPPSHRFMAAAVVAAIAIIIFVVLRRRNNRLSCD